MTSDLVLALSGMKEQEALNLARKALEAGNDPLRVLEQCREAVELVGRYFEEGKYFLPELIMAGEILKDIGKMAEPYLKQEAGPDAQRIGRVVIGSVAGDIHDIGKDMVAFLLDVNGFEVHDLGVDVSPERFVQAVKDLQPQVVGMSALLSTVLKSMKETVEAISEAGVRDKVRIMVGGSAVDDGVAEFAGADAYGRDAVAAVTLAKGWVGG
jgi:5-methyltetrahydrofolate--homocysteine methyltransferase